MSGTEPAPTADAGPGRARLDGAGFAALVRPRISVLVVLQAIAGFLLARPDDFAPLGWLVAGTALVSAGGCALNHWLERDADARMPRTSGRPLVTGALSPGQVAGSGVGAALAGLALLWVGCGPLATGLEALAAAIYLGVYTPLKRRTSTNTWVGAIPGALPLLAGAAAAGRGLPPLALWMFLLVFLWQLPHFFAIASMYREQYREGGMRMLSGDDPHDALLRWQMPMMVMSVMLVSVLPLLSGEGRELYAACALSGGGLFLAAAFGFRRRPDRPRARRVVLASVAYLPLVLGALVLDVACAGRPADEASGVAEAVPQGRPPSPPPDASGLPVLAVLPDFALVSQAGTPIDRATLADGGTDPWIVDFIFTNCAGICVPMTSALVDLQQEQLPARYLSITVDPERDSPAVLSAFREKWEGDPSRWLLATGSHEAIEALGEGGFRLPVQTGRAKVEGMPGLFHSGKFALLDTSGRVRGYYAHDDKLALAALRRDVEALRAARAAAREEWLAREATGGGIGPEASDAGPR